MVLKIFNLLRQEGATQICSENQALKSIRATNPPVLNLYFVGWKKYSILLFLHEN